MKRIRFIWHYAAGILEFWDHDYAMRAAQLAMRGKKND